MKFYTTIEQSNIHLQPSLVEILVYPKMIKPFQPRQTPFLSVPSIVFTGSLLVAVKRAICWLYDEDATLEMDRVITAALVEVYHRLVDVFLWLLFPDGLQGNFQLIGRLRLWLKFMVLFQHATPDMIVQMC